MHFFRACPHTTVQNMVQLSSSVATMRLTYYVTLNTWCVAASMDDWPLEGALTGPACRQ